MPNHRNLLAGCFAFGMALCGAAIAPSTALSQEVRTTTQSSPFLVAAKIGTSVQVYWKGTWYDATIIDIRGGKYKITYDGYDSSWDEYVVKSRIRWKVGNSVEVYWKGSWYGATVIDVRGNNFKITYDGYDSSWDEFVGADRIR